MKLKIALSACASLALLTSCGGDDSIEIGNTGENIYPVMSHAKATMSALARSDRGSLIELLDAATFDAYLKDAPRWTKVAQTLKGKFESKQIEKILLNSDGKYLRGERVAGSLHEFLGTFTVDVYAKPSFEKLGQLSLTCHVKSEAWAMLLSERSQMSSCRVSKIDVLVDK